ncbi:MAG: hypothetical protein A3B70_07460 [Deltaproteobacteria bacterium RIFCSPHIGHO2_02_FULL_40_11]|nr:MAG: hypothetical protein A3B70_07460 [Deltaproteobacteria bacterium RIFCSPHIGHO2_02_FULL_40_11]
MEEKNARSPAVKLMIFNISQAAEDYEQETSRTYLQVGTQRVFRVNVVAVLVAKEKQGTILRLFLDDGSGKIAAYFFEENAAASQARVGEAIFIIGKVRHYNQERYLSPEIVRVAHPFWLKVRALELPFSNPSVAAAEEVIVECKADDLPIAKISNIIKALDQGDGVRIEDVLTHSHLNNTEKFIEKMLQDGDIFQNAPGKIKII